MNGLIYRLFVGASRGVGVWVVAAFAWLVSTGWFLFRRRRVAASVDFYRALFPDRSRREARRLTWRQYHAFAALFAERLRLGAPGAIACDEDGLERLDEAARAGRGAILVMSHVGSWEIAARLLRRRGFKLLLHMGAREREQVERLQKADVRGEGVQVVVAAPGTDSVFDAVESLHFLREGGFVSLPADRARPGGERAVEVRFLGRTVRVSATPWLLALLSHAPLFHFFAVRTGRNRYRCSVSAPVRLESVRRVDRDETIRSAVQAYADELATVVRAAPEQWYTFEPFFPE